MSVGIRKSKMNYNENNQNSNNSKDDNNNNKNTEYSPSVANESRFPNTFSEENRSLSEEQARDDVMPSSVANESRFLNVFSGEKRSPSEEQTRDDDMPSTSGASVGILCESLAVTTSNAKNDGEENTTIPSSSTTIPSSSTTIPCSKSVESHRPCTGMASKGKRKRKGKRGGKPGGLNDSRKVGMSGATVKWYFRHLQAGKSSEEANELALGRNKITPAVEKRIPVTAIPSRVVGGCAPYQDRKDDAEKRKITPEELPSLKKQKQNLHQQPTQLKEEQNTVPKTGIRIAVLPLNYPVEAMDPQQLTVLADKIIDEVYKAWKHALCFCGVCFRSGL
ncbi:mediator of RNA polymerase II transcription subunit 13-like [Bactrocera tryoni]|uniref:mediator of RNA polymerase II transcription subunit 13-like n=1 Tax=Bactrocera tryoni TaxID=59916 RepID=UPI001A983563|nr:mediator of RNA polymerase II transcription subunit 13-like [Bactrocera tryoni]